MRRHIPLIAIALLLLCSNSLWAQRNGRKIEVTGDVAVTQLVEKHIEFNDRLKTCPGYRIQIASLSGNNAKSNAFALRDNFLKEYPDMTAYIVFDEPNFKVKVGDFRTRLDAYVYLQYIKNNYPGVIMKDNVYPIRLDLDTLIPETDEDALY